MHIHKHGVFTIFEALRERTEHLDIFFRPSLSGVLFPMFCLLVEGECQLNSNYSVNILSECLRILIDCSQLSKTYYNVLFSSSTRDRHTRRI